VRVVGILGLQRDLLAASKVSDVVDVQCSGVGGEDERLRRESVDKCGRIDATVGAISCQHFLPSTPQEEAHGSSGTVIFAVT
jgi:hypothetical protein